MICDRCGKREATVFIRRDGMAESALCEVCAREQGISAEDGRLSISLEDLFSPQSVCPDRPGYRYVCSFCGTRMEEVRKTGRIGCPACFTSFRTEILSYLKRRGRTGEYKGSAPRRFGTQRSRERKSSAENNPDKADFLDAKLREALDSENYEQAARIRDAIRKTRGS